MLKKEEGFDLPEDFVVKILCRLPVKTLIRFTCVSKRWRFIIISDPQFAKSHLQLALQQGTLSQRIFVSIDPKYFWESPQFQSWEENFKGSVRHLTFPSEERNQLVRTSCNGLVLLGDSYLTGLVALSIWNPSTGFFRKIPSPRMTECTDEKGGKKDLDFVISGFGYVSSTDDYKLVFVIPGDSTHFHVYIFSLRANSWKVIEAPHLSSPDCHHEVGTLSNEAIHWINYGRGVSDPASMYAFDLAEEFFREMTLPVCYPDDDRDMRVLSSGGCLCMWLMTDGGLGCEIWGMTEYAVPESWVKLFGFRKYDLPDVFTSLHCGWHLCSVTEGGTVVIQLFGSKELVRIECRKEEKPICSGRYNLPEELRRCRHYFHTTSYGETLVSAPE
ncbi:F-box protein CPR1-like [Rosa sericea]